PRAAAPNRTSRAPGVPVPVTNCWPATAASGAGRDAGRGGAARPGRHPGRGEPSPPPVSQPLSGPAPPRGSRARGPSGDPFRGGPLTLYLPRTTTAQITEALAAERRSVGGGAMNLVLTLVIVTDETDHYDALQAATEAGREHPSRVIALILRDPDTEPAIDA